jgi:pantetheine-phosphate adenylyltransferase
MTTPKRAIYAGSFDPLTFGHLNIIERGCKLVDELIVAVANNTAKKGVFTPDERIAMIADATRGLPGVRAATFEGLLVEYARKIDARVLVRGLRSVKDFEYEFQMALTNKALWADLETVFLVTEGQYAHIASSLVREIAAMGGDVSSMVPPSVAQRMADRLAERS